MRHGRKNGNGTGRGRWRVEGRRAKGEGEAEWNGMAKGRRRIKPELDPESLESLNHNIFVSCILHLVS
jgi:hypothetical protein